MEWKNIKQQEPPLDEGILITDGVIITVCKLNKSGNDLYMYGHGFGGYEYEFDFNDSDITYWMNLPKLPIEKLVSKKFTEEEAIKIFRWLLGYTDFPPRKDGEGAYWWRSNLRVLLNRVGITKKVLEDSKFSG